MRLERLRIKQSSPPLTRTYSQYNSSFLSRAVSPDNVEYRLNRAIKNTTPIRQNEVRSSGIYSDRVYAYILRQLLNYIVEIYDSRSCDVGCVTQPITTIVGYEIHGHVSSMNFVMNHLES